MIQASLQPPEIPHTSLLCFSERTGDPLADNRTLAFWLVEYPVCILGTKSGGDICSIPIRRSITSRRCCLTASAHTGWSFEFANGVLSGEVGRD